MALRLLRGGLTALFIATLMPTAQAGSDFVPPVRDPEVKKLCGECHLAFPPAFLPARSWDRLLDTQSDHFGEDLALSPEEVQRVKSYLRARAGDMPNSGGPRKFLRWMAPGATPIRITENPAFLREHNFPDRVWRDPKVVTRSNCQACHAGADRGLFDDD